MTSYRNLVTGATVVIAFAMTSAGCGAGWKDRPPEVGFGFASQQVFPNDNPDIVLTVQMSSSNDSSVTVTDVAPVADRGMTADYLGWSTCSNGCAGTGWWEDAETRKLAVRSIEGRLPLTLPAGGFHSSFVFRLRVTHPEAERRLRAGCFLGVRHVELTLDTGDTLNASGLTTYVVGIHGGFEQGAPRPPLPAGCVTDPSQEDEEPGQASLPVQRPTDSGIGPQPPSRVAPDGTSGSR